MTDDWKAYASLDKEFASHDVICHGSGDYARKRDDGMSINTNTAESFFALLKRGHYGTFHWFSRKHTHRYCDEFGFRWDRRKVSDGERMVSAIKGAEGKRLMYRDSFRGTETDREACYGEGDDDRCVWMGAITLDVCAGYRQVRVADRRLDD